MTSRLQSHPAPFTWISRVLLPFSLSIFILPMTGEAAGVPGAFSGTQVAQAATEPEKADERSTGPVQKDERQQEKNAAAADTTSSGSWQQLIGADYIGLPDVDREIYVIGLSDAYNWSYAGGFKKMRWLVDCTENKWGEELMVLFDQWLESNPDRWEEPAAKLFAFAIFNQCDFAAGTK